MDSKTTSLKTPTYHLGLVFIILKFMFSYWTEGGGGW